MGGMLKAELLKLVQTACTDAKILHCPKHLALDLKEFYAFMFARLERGDLRDIEVGKRLFRLVLFARRPLTVVELRHALLIVDDRNAPSCEEYHQNIIWVIAKRIEHCGGNFLEINGNYS